LAIKSIAKGSQLEKEGFQENDVLLLVNKQQVLDKAAFAKILSFKNNQHLTVTIVRNQGRKEIKFLPHVVYEVSSSKTANTFDKLSHVPKGVKLYSNNNTSNDPLESLIDGKLMSSYGPVFANGLQDGMYKMDLGASKKLGGVNCWTYNFGTRGKLDVIVYGSNAKENPGWDVKNTAKFTPIGTINTKNNPQENYNLASLTSPKHDLGSYRWIVWRLTPLNEKGENSAVQELSVEFAE